MCLEEFSLLSNLYNFFCILSVHISHVLGLGVIGAFKHDWEKTKVQLVTTNEILKEYAEGAEHTWNLRKKVQRFHFMPIHNWLFKVKLIQPKW